MSTWVLKISTTSFGNQFLYLTTIMVKTFFLIPNQTFPYYSLCPLPLIISVYLQEKSSSISSIPFIQVLFDSTKVVSWPSFWILSWSSSLRLVLNAICYSPLATSVGVHKLTSSFFWWAKTGHSAPQSVSQMPSRGQGPSPDLLATLLPMQPRETGDFLCCKSTLLVHTQIAVHQAPQIPLDRKSVV